MLVVALTLIITDSVARFAKQVQKVSYPTHTSLFLHFMQILCSIVPHSFGNIKVLAVALTSIITDPLRRINIKMGKTWGFCKKCAGEVYLPGKCPHCGRMNRGEHGVMGASLIVDDPKMEDKVANNEMIATTKEKGKKNENMEGSLKKAKGQAEGSSKGKGNGEGSSKGKSKK